MLVTARRFPGIDDTRLDALASPPAIDKSVRRFTAPELLGGPGTLDAPAPEASLPEESAGEPRAPRVEQHDEALLSADFGELRDRL